MLDYIDAGRVVPVVSKELLAFGDASHPGLLYPYYAQRLATELAVPAHDLVGGSEINDVACRYLAINRNRDDAPQSRIYRKLNKVVADGESFACPFPLLQLARITPFRLFVSTTFDSSMTRALNQVRFGGLPRTRIVSYTRSKQDDLPEGQDAVGQATVFHLFGKATVMPEYAVTQWDLVEYFHDLSSGPRPERLLDELREKSLLILGSSFDGWLTRFFLRISKGNLGSRLQAPDYIADPQLNADTNLVLFIQVLRRGTEIYSTGGPIEFVDELYRRWTGIHPSGPDPPVPPALPAKGAVFLSYAKEDRESVEKIKAALVKVGVDVFVDDEVLQPGQAWEGVLERKINEACVFIAVVSKYSLSDEPRFVHREWRLAIERAKYASFSPEVSYLIPVFVDSTSPQDPAIPREFSAAHWAVLPGGTPPDAFVALVQNQYRRRQKALGVGGS